jgi:hypothetical protein
MPTAPRKLSSWPLGSDKTCASSLLTRTCTNQKAQRAQPPRSHLTNTQADHTPYWLCLSTGILHATTCRTCPMNLLLAKAQAPAGSVGRYPPIQAALENILQFMQALHARITTPSGHRLRRTKCAPCTGSV